ncbi:MAG: ComEA family DNA-binding protein [Gammaproteobacteria bacterium]
MRTIKLFVGMLLLAMSFWSWADQVNINTADAQTLATELTGVGAAKAQAIIDYRKAHGRFKTVNELANVKGISSKTIEKNKANIVLSKK